MKTRGTVTSRGVVRATLIALVYLLAAGAVYVIFVRTAFGQRLDGSSFAAVTDIRSAIGPWAGRIRVALLVLSGLLVAVLLVLALVRRRFRDAIVAVAICVITIALSLTLKDLVLTRPALGQFGYSYNTFPSDHEAITTAALIASYLLLPGRVRQPLALLGLVVVGAASGLIQVVTYAHRPSDVLAGALLAGAVSAAFLVRRGSLGKAARWAIWLVAGLAAVVATFCFLFWHSSGYSPDAHWIGVLAVLFGSTSTVAAALAIGAELRSGSAQPEYASP